MIQPIEVLGAMITPAVLISAAALLQLSTANRLSRVNDRLQDLTEKAEEELLGKGIAVAATKQELILRQIASLLERLLLLRSAVTGIYVTIALLIITSILGGLYAAFPRISSLWPISVGIFGAVAFLYCIVVLIREASIAVRMTLHEISYMQELLERHK
jgi:hypothetical protein